MRSINHDYLLLHQKIKPKRKANEQKGKTSKKK